MNASQQIHLTGIGITGFRSFSQDPQLISGLSKVNVFVGRNNSGKSNIIRHILCQAGRDLTAESPYEQENDHHNESPQPPLTGMIVSLDFLEPTQRVEIFGDDPPEIDVWFDRAGKITLAGKSELLKRLDPTKIGRLRKYLRKYGLETDAHGGPELSIEAVISSHAIREFSSYFKQVVFVPELRDLRVGKSSSSRFYSTIAGEQVISDLFRAKLPRIKDRAHRKRFEAVQQLVRDLLNEPSLQLELPHVGNELNVEINDTPRPIESCGTGVRELVILCSAIALRTDTVFCIEEPESHLHPELQRQFLRFINQTENRFFITTHSSTLIDSALGASIYHVELSNGSSRISTLTLRSDAHKALDDLGYRASDLVQTNGVVWVEGPSDRIYIRRWLDCLPGGSSLLEGIHFSFLYYGGRLLSHYGASDLVLSDASSDSFIDMLNINRHTAVVMDHDGDSGDAPLTPGKQKIQAELQDKYCWITQGREIENYVTDSAWTQFLCSEDVQNAQVELSAFQRIDEALQEACAPTGSRAPKYSSRKVEYANRTVSFIHAGDLNHLDLNYWITRLAHEICRWNGIVPDAFGIPDVPAQPAHDTAPATGPSSAD